MDTTTWIEDVEANLRERFDNPKLPTRLTVLFDPSCGLCRRCCNWMLGQESYVELEFLPCTEVQARERFGNIPWLGDELVVVSETGEVWAGPAAFLNCLWALREFRPWSYRLAGPALAPLSERFFLLISGNRKHISKWFRGDSCESGTCALGRR